MAATTDSNGSFRFNSDANAESYPRDVSSHAGSSIARYAHDSADGLTTAAKDTNDSSCTIGPGSFAPCSTGSACGRQAATVYAAIADRKLLPYAPGADFGGFCAFALSLRSARQTPSLICRLIRLKAQPHSSCFFGTFAGWDQYQLQTRVLNFCGNICAKISGALDGFPCGTGAVKAEVLVVQLDRNLLWRRRQMRDGQTGQRLPDERFQLSCGTGFYQRRGSRDEVGRGDLRGNGEV